MRIIVELDPGGSIGWDSEYELLGSRVYIPCDAVVVKITGVGSRPGEKEPTVLVNGRVVTVGDSVKAGEELFATWSASHAIATAFGWSERE